MLRNKENGLSVIINSKLGNEGHIVTCVRLLGSGRYKDGAEYPNVWEIHPTQPGGAWAIPDSAMRPIGNPGPEAVDEMVLRVPLPTLEPA